MTGEQLEAGNWRTYRDFYRWGSILRGAATKPTLAGGLRHLAYATGWKKFEPPWDWIIRGRQTHRILPVLEAVLSGCGLLDGHEDDAPRGALPVGVLHDVRGGGTLGEPDFYLETRLSMR